MLEVIVLGVIQGVTEFLPISSSGHLILIPKIFSWQDPGLAFDAVLHLATGLAILSVFKREIGKMVGSLRPGASVAQKKENLRLLLLIILAAIPAAVVGFFGEKLIEKEFRSTAVVAGALIIGALFLFLAEWYVKRSPRRMGGLKAISWKQSLVVGVWQIFSLVPGFSRSGATVTGGMFARLDRKTAVRFSFLAGLPTILGAGMWELLKLEFSMDKIGMLMIGFVSAFVAGILSLRLLLWLADKANFNIFVVYRVVLGIVLLVFFV